MDFTKYDKHTNDKLVQLQSKVDEYSEKLEKVELTLLNSDDEIIEKFTSTVANYRDNIEKYEGYHTNYYVNTNEGEDYRNLVKYGKELEIEEARYNQYMYEDYINNVCTELSIPEESIYTILKTVTRRSSILLDYFSNIGETELSDFEYTSYSKIIYELENNISSYITSLVFDLLENEVNYLRIKV